MFEKRISQLAFEYFRLQEIKRDWL